MEEAEAAQAERLVVEGLKRMRWSEADLTGRRKGERGKIQLARELRPKTTTPVAWIAARLNVGSRGHLAWLLQQRGSGPARRAHGPTSPGNMTISLTVYGLEAGTPIFHRHTGDSAGRRRDSPAKMRADNPTRVAGLKDPLLLPGLSARAAQHRVVWHYATDTACWVPTPATYLNLSCHGHAKAMVDKFP